MVIKERSMKYNFELRSQLVIINIDIILIDLQVEGVITVAKLVSIYQVKLQRYSLYNKNYNSCMTIGINNHGQVKKKVSLTLC